MVADDQTSLAAAVASIAVAHDADPTRASDGRAAERVYAERVVGWVERLCPAVGPALRLAAHAQHLERWAIPRNTYPDGRAGYLAWRKAVQHRQRDRLVALCSAAGVDPATAARAGVLVAKTTRPGDPDGQVLEDAACLVFFVHELEPFLAAHPELPEPKLRDIVAKTWAKMSPPGREAARTDPAMPAAVAALLRDC